jgi:hypothetical protein
MQPGKLGFEAYVVRILQMLVSNLPVLPYAIPQIGNVLQIGQAHGRYALEFEMFGWTSLAMENNSDPLDKMIRYFAAMQALPPGWAGFKWKPMFFDEKYAKALQWLGQRGVKMVFNVRNPLDVLLSSYKHSDRVLLGSDSSDSSDSRDNKSVENQVKNKSVENKSVVKAHCKLGDAKCLATHEVGHMPVFHIILSLIVSFEHIYIQHMCLLY